MTGLAQSLPPGGRPGSDMTFDNLGGITQDIAITGISQDEKGAMLLQEGKKTYKYDGYKLEKNTTAPKHPEAQELPDGETITATAEIQGVEYAATATALYQKDKNGKLVLLLDSLFHPSCIVEGEKPELIYIGTGNSLHRYDARKGLIVRSFAIPVVKTMLKKGKHLWMGTDDGLYILTGDSLSKIEHNAYKSETSLAANVVYCLYQDKDGNIWAGTNNGVSVMRQTSDIRWYQLPDITHQSRGCKITLLMTDDKHRLWTGGDNGLICVENFFSDTLATTCKWYKMGDKEYPLPHNMVRDICQDRQGRILAATDGGLLILDSTKMQFKRFLIEQDKNNWVYGVRQAEQGIIVTTFDKTYVLDNISLKVIEEKEKEQFAPDVISDTEGHQWREDKVSGLMWTGGNDQFAMATKEALQKLVDNQKQNKEKDEKTKRRPVVTLLITAAILALLLIGAVLLFRKKRKSMQEVIDTHEDSLKMAKEKEATLQKELTAAVRNDDAALKQPSADDSFLLKITSVIEENIDNPKLSAATLSELTDCNQRTLTRKIKQLTNMTTMEYIRSIRMKQAAQMLKGGNFTVAEVMYRVGYNNASYFSRSFAAQFGMPPSEYKNAAEPQE